MYHKFYNDFCVDSEGNKAKLKYCAAKGDNDNQTFVYNLNGYLENSKGKCLYYDDNGSGPQLGKEIKIGSVYRIIKKTINGLLRKIIEDQQIR